MSEVRFSTNLISDVLQMWSLPFMVNAFRAGTIVAVLSALIGWYLVLRRQTFVGHTLSAVGFPGAAGAAWLGIGVTAGYVASCIAAAAVIAALTGRGSARHAQEAALVGTLQAFLLACGFVFVTLYHGALGGTSALLFGSFLGITAGQVRLLGVVAIAAAILLAMAGRPLLLASVEPDLAAAAGAPVRALDAGFLLLLGVAVAEISSVTGALLVFALLVLPAATAQAITMRPARSLALAVTIGLATTWIALTAAYYSRYPLGFWLTGIAFAGYAAARAGRAVSDRRPSTVPR